MELQKKKTIHQEILENPRAGPKPISIEEYRRRIQKLAAEPKHQTITKTRGGRQAQRSNEIKTLHRLANLAITKEENQRFKREIKELQKERSREYKIKKKEKKKKRQAKIE